MDSNCAANLIEAIASLENLRLVNLQGNALTGEALLTIAKVLAQSKKLKFFLIEKSNLSEEDITKIQDTLPGVILELPS